MPELKVGELKQLLVGLCPGLLHELVPGLKREGSRVFSAPNPRRGETKAGSFKLWANGAWREYDEAEDVGKGDILGLIAYVRGFAPKSTEGRREAIQWAKARLGLSSATPEQMRRTRISLSREAQERKRTADMEESARAQRRYARALDIWSHARADETAIARYLEGRGIDLFAIQHRSHGLRLHPALDHWAMPQGVTWRGPAMVAKIVNGAGVMAGVHCTYLTDDCSARVPKTIMPNGKLMLGAVKGGIVPLTYGPSGLPVGLACEQGVGGTVILAEGIENAAAVAQAVPEARVWACLNLGNLAHAPVHLACVDEIVLALDNDTKEQPLAQRAKVIAALEAHGKPLRLMPPRGGKDFAAVMKGET